MNRAGRATTRPAPGGARVGVSGWLYPSWRGRFYPPGLPHRLELTFAATKLGSVEINGTFYSMKRPETFQAWRDQTPAGFLFAVKGSRYITHMKKLSDIEAPLANFFAQGLLRLGDKLGPILWQLPERLRFDEARLDDFLARLPRTTREAARLARRHDARLDGRSHTRAEHDGEIRHALEVRHPSYASLACVRLLRRHRVALVVADTAGRFPCFEDVTADFVYVRLHGAEHLYASGYRPDELDGWAERLRAWGLGGEPADARRVASAAPPAKRRDVYVYFDNDAHGHAPFDAMELASRLGVEPLAGAEELLERGRRSRASGTAQPRRKAA